ncbi:MAG TPA: hypothetical protein EYG31_04700 [Porticoccaceae bacterium]|jgi:mannose-6-phosphate isomerase-like protein (cupin superfamily)|nr:hypothetical protein [Gammaproteobacteria bacterium]HIL59921.1 hypothetical protein [Porticoccaceae bacterium]
MGKLKLIAMIFLLGVTAATAQSSKPPAFYMQASDIASAMQQAIAERPSMAVSRVKVADDHQIALIRRTEAAGPIIHERGTEMHFITEGAGTLLTGGVVIRPENGTAYIQDGLARRVTAGDVVLIDEGTPHQYTAIESVVVYLEVRFSLPYAD